MATFTFQGKNTGTFVYALRFGHKEWTVGDLSSYTFEDAITVLGKPLKDVTFDQLKGASFTFQTKNLSVEGSSTSEGPNSPGTMADDDTVGTVAWGNPDNAKASDDNDAIADTFGNTSHYLKATNFGFSIPSGVTINGIKVEVEKADAGNNAVDNAVRIVKGGSIGSTDKSDGSAWETSDAYTTYGSSTDLWGESWTPTQINASNFGFVISAVGTGASSAHIDHIRITIYYTTASTWTNLGKN